MIDFVKDFKPSKPKPLGEVELAAQLNSMAVKPLTERQRIVAFIAARLFPYVYTLDDARNRDAVELAGKVLDEVIRQNP